MAGYRIKLTPDLINLASEGSLDTSVANGVSIQRTAYIEVYNTGKRKIVSAVDGTSFNDSISVWSNNDDIEAL